MDVWIRPSFSVSDHSKNLTFKYLMKTSNKCVFLGLKYMFTIQKGRIIEINEIAAMVMVK